MSKVLQHKVVAALPTPLEPDSIYYVRKGDGFDIHVTNGVGVVTAYSLNADAKLDGKVDSNDPRLTDSREWSEDTVTQTEVEAGISSARKAFTVQRVWQAINAWWQLVTSGFGRNFIAASNEQTARNVLQLGTVATRDVATNAQALTGTAGVLPDAAGVHVAFKQFGYGGQNPLNLALDCNDLPAGSRNSWTDGISESTAVSLNLPTLGGSSSDPRSWHVECFGIGSNRLVQEATEVFGAGTTRGRTFIRVKHDATWYPWQEVPIANGDGKISTNWLKTDVSTDPLSVTDIVLTRGAYGIGDVGTHDNFPTPTSLVYNSFWGGNCVFINSKGSPYGSMLLLEQNKLSFGSINNDDGLWAAEVITDKNQVVLGTTSKSARQALELMDEGDGWVDLRPYLLPPFYWDTVRDTRNKFPRIRKNPSGWVELDGVVSWNESPAAPQNGVAFRVPTEFRPAYTSAGVSFVDSTPLYFGTGQWIMTGEDEYSNGLHGEMMLILGDPPAISQGVFGLNGVGWFLD